VAAKGGEEMRFVREDLWRGVELRQDVVGGDTLRTNAIGTLAILFADQTQIRVGRQSTLVVREVATGQGNTQLDLQAGQVWARAARGGTGVDVRTPAAVAAIRGTDWSLSVDPSGKTSLIVLEGVVELSNAQGSVTVRQGEGAVAAIGQAPTKFVLVNSNDREQMLFYYGLRDAFTGLPATGLKGPAMRAERARLVAIPPDARRAEDWLSLAEISLELDGRAGAAAALAEARRLPLSAAQRARADLVAGLLAGAGRRWSEAAALFARAERGVGGDRRVTAAYGRYIAASMADPKRALPEPRVQGGGPMAAMAQAFVAGFRQDLNAAAEVIKAAEKKYPNDARLAVFSAQLAFLLNRRDDMRASLARAVALDPDDPEVLLASGGVKAAIDSDIEGALADMRRAAAIAPGNASVWNGIGLVESERDATLEAEAAFRRAIAEDPDDPVAYANLAIHILDQNRVDEAGALIDRAFELDPAFHAGYVHRGRYLLQKGRGDEAIASILAGLAANPAYSQGLLMAAAAYYQNGEEELARQALDNADRLDPNDPVVSVARTAFAIDGYRADEAILSAREALRRYRARGGYFAPLAVNRQGGSFMADAYRFVGLNEWGRFYGDRVFNPFEAASYFDQAASFRPRLTLGEPRVSDVEDANLDLTSLNLVVQGLFFDPLAVSGRIGRTDILRRPFLDAEVGGELVDRDGRLGWRTEANVAGFVNNPIPTSFSLNASRTRGNERNVLFQEEADSGSVFIGMAPSAADRFLVFGTASEGRPGLVSPLPPERASERRDDTSVTAGGGWSHTFGHRNVLTGALFYTRGDSRQAQSESGAGLVQESPSDLGFPFPGLAERSYLAALRQESDRRSRVDGTVAALGHTFGLGDFTLRSGLEGQTGETRADARSVSLEAYRETAPPGGIGPFDLNRLNGQESRLTSSFRAVRGYADLFWRPSDRFELQAGGQYAFADIDSRGTVTTVNGFNFYNVDPFLPFLPPLSGPVRNSTTTTRPVVTEQESSRFDPRVGAAFSPVEGHWLRAAYRYDTEFPLGLTLSPVTTVGLIPNPVPTNGSSRTETLALRWDAEWSPQVFTAVEYQRQDVRGLDLPILNTLASLDLDRGRIDRLSATANVWLGHGIGVFGTVGAAETENLTGGAFYGRQIPFIAERFARAGLTFVHPSRLKVTLAQSFFGDITGDLTGQALKDFRTTDASITWETPDRHLLLGLTALNLFDEDYRFAPNVPGTGRTVAASLKARF
jgi:tetratricopeptide (TPR) repeat protein